jgi:SAM-dependent methyltransferase/8-oxo-dGTP pyrophosphatase MutT (NUDIX family)
MADAPTFGERTPGLAYRLRRGAYGVALLGDRVLVVDAPEGRFLPGGGLGAEEMAEAGLEREMREETGHAVLSVEPLGSASQLILARKDGEPIEKVGEFFAVRLSTRPVVAASETDHVVHWLPLAEAVETLTDESHRWAVRRASDSARTSCQCPAEVDPRIAGHFDRCNRRRREGVERYELGTVSRTLLDALLAAGPAGKSVLEPGCGPGALLGALLDAGARSATGVDLSAEAIEYARERSAAAGYVDRVVFAVDDAATAELPAHDWVVLDKVICCYARMDALMANTVASARALYGMALPASYGWRGGLARAIGWFEDVTNSLRGRPCPGYVHDVRLIESRLAEAGFRPMHRQTTGLWHVGVYGRPEPVAAST